MKILIIGKTGMLGDDLAEKYRDKYEVTIVGEESLDLRRPDTIKDAVCSRAFDVVINCAALTNVDQCEQDAELAHQLNGEGPGHIAKICAETGSKLVHISTDYVFEGRPEIPYKEDEPPSPISIYSESKVKGEQQIRKFLDNHLIVRSAWIYGYKDKSFVNFMLKKAEAGEDINVVNEQIGSPTYTMDIGEGILRLIKSNCTGTYHLTNSGCCTRYEFAQEIFRLGDFDPGRLKSISSKELNWIARRPKCLILDMQKLQNDTGYMPRHWKLALKEHLQEQGYGKERAT